jgi:hypothetical protein
MKEEIVLRPSNTEDFPAICRLLGTVFHDDIAGELKEMEAGVFEVDRSLVTEDAGPSPGISRSRGRCFRPPTSPASAYCPPIAGRGC